MASEFANPYEEFAGKHAIIAGVGKNNIGAAVAEALHSLGATVTMIDLFPQAALEMAAHMNKPGKPSIIALKANLADKIDRQKAIEEAIHRHGLPSYFVSTIGKDERVPFSELSDEKEQELNDANFAGPFRAAKDLIEPMRRNGGGSILLFTSHHGDEINDPQMAGYGMAKAKLNKGISYLAAETAIGNTSGNIIRVNGFCPGWVWTPAQEARFSKEQQAAGIAEQAIPHKLTPKGQAKPVLSVLSDVWGETTGRIFFADGGSRPAGAVAAKPIDKTL